MQDNNWDGDGNGCRLVGKGQLLLEFGKVVYREKLVLDFL